MQIKSDLDLKQIESDIRNNFTNINLQKLIEDSKINEIMFIEGPPTLNGTPHIGHLRGRIIKDLWYRYNTLKGYRIKFNSGWDTQGLPVELQAEKELGISGSKKEMLTSIGIEKLVSECRKLVNKYHKIWLDMDLLLGMSFNQKLAYWTYDNKYMEKEWQFLKKAYENGILTSRYKVIAYCPSCQTSLSHTEISQTYEVVEDPSLYYKIKLEKENIFLVVWTTMPFTLVTDAMVCVNPNENYVYMNVNDEVWVLCEKQLNAFVNDVSINNYKILKTVKGIELEGKKYVHPLLKKIPKLNELAKNIDFHIVVAEKFVDVDTGSGIVHIAPANGEVDYDIAIKRHIPIFNPINDEVKFTADAGEYAGLFVRNADQKIVDDILKCDALIKIGKIKHKYPLCWRSRHKIVWLAKREYFYMINKLGDKAINAANKVDYFFDQTKNRFLKIIEEKHPWCISRERFWGSPIPIWNCKNCGNIERLFSRNEIIDHAYKLPDGPNFELHRPWIDNIVIKCKKCSTIMKREPFVLDTWHNSGAAAYASLSENEYNNKIPVKFLTEGIDQTRGWAYTLLIENVILRNEQISPYKSFLFQGHVLDKNGNKMSKSSGNVIDAIKLLTKYPVDIIRYYFIWKSNPIEPINFSEKELMLRPYQIINTLYNLHLYFKQNSEYEKFIPVECCINENILQITDMWILSKLQKLIIQIDINNTSCRFHETAKALENFIINLFSQSYIPIIRNELWNETESKKERRRSIYKILFHILKTIYILIHPLCPFISEYLYHSIFKGKKSILLDTWPQPQIKLVNDDIEKSFDLMKEIISMSIAARMKGGLKRRWPLDKVIICIDGNKKSILEPVNELLVSQINIKQCNVTEINYSNDILKLILELNVNKLPIIPQIKLDKKNIAPKLKHDIKLLLDEISKIDPYEIIRKLYVDRAFICYLGTKKIVLNKNDFIINFDSKDNFIKIISNNIIVFLSTIRSKKTRDEGIIKDLARRLQSLRKERGYKPTMILNTASILDLDTESLKIIKEKEKELTYLVRVKQINFIESCTKYKCDDINGRKIRISIE